jgi:hypothetical protein
MGNELDLLVVGNCVLRKPEQNAALKQDYSSAFELDEATASERIHRSRGHLVNGLEKQRLHCERSC